MSEISGQTGGERDADVEPSRPAELQVDARGARWLRRHLGTGVCVITTAAESAFRGATVTACTIVSIEPLQLLVSIELHSQMDCWLEESGAFAACVLPWQQQLLADQFAGFAPRARRDLGGVEHFTAVTGSPILARSIAWIDCRVTQTLATGDHRCYIGEAVALGRGLGDIDDPLLYYLNRYRRLS